MSDEIILTANATGGEGDLKYSFFAKKDGKTTSISSYSSKKSVSWELPAEGTYDLYVKVKDSNDTEKVVDEPVKIKVSASDDDSENPKEGDNKNVLGFLLTGIFGVSLLGALKRKKNI